MKNFDQLHVRVEFVFAVAKGGPAFDLPALQKAVHETVRVYAAGVGAAVTTPIARAVALENEDATP